MDTNLLEEKLSEYGNPEAEALNYIKEHIEEDTFCPNQIILHEGTPNRRIYFVKEGIVYAETGTENKTEVKWIVTKGYFFTDCPSFETSGNSQTTLVSVNNSTIQSLGISAFTYLTDHFPRTRAAIENLQKSYHEEIVHHLSDFKSKTPFDILLEMYTAHPELIGMLSRKTLAAYLNVSRNTLVKLLKMLPPGGRRS